MKKIAIKAWREVVNKPAESEVDFHGLKLTIKHRLSLEEMVRFVNECVTPCFDNDDHKFDAEIKDFVLKSNIVEYYTNLTLPENMSDRYDMLYKLWENSKFCELLYGNINRDQYERMLEAIDSKIDEENYMNELLFSNRMAKIANSIETLINSIGAAMSSVNEDDVAKLIKKLKDDGFDEEKLVEAVLEHEAKEDGGAK